MPFHHFLSSLLKSHVSHKFSLIESLPRCARGSKTAHRFVDSLEGLSPYALPYGHDSLQQKDTKPHQRREKYGVKSRGNQARASTGPPPCGHPGGASLQR